MELNILKTIKIAKKIITIGNKTAQELKKYGLKQIIYAQKLFK